MTRAAFALLAAAAVGCSSRPHAPALTQSQLFQDDAIGLRFRVPDGWVQTSRATLPAGKLPKESAVVYYRLMYGDKPAAFEVTCADLAEDTDLAKHLTYGPWRMAAKPQPEGVGGKPATRYALLDKAGLKQERRETVAVRRGPRVFFFTVTAAPNDKSAVATSREILGGVTWKE